MKSVCCVWLLAMENTLFGLIGCSKLRVAHPDDYFWAKILRIAHPVFSYLPPWYRHWQQTRVIDPYLHFVLLFWNHVFTWASVIFSAFAMVARSADARYFCRWNLFSNSQIWRRVNDVRGFLRFGGVRFW